MDLRQNASTAVAVRFILAGGVASLALTACSSHHTAIAPSPAPAPSTATPAMQLAAVASVAKGAEYVATYTAHSDATGAEPARTSTIQAYRTTAATRLDVDEQSTNVLIQVDATGTSSCTVSSGAPSACVRLAGPSASIPTGIPDPGLQHTFTSSLDVLAAGTDLTVAAAPSIPAANGLPAASCFALIAAPADTSVTPGTYCFSASGIVVRAQFRSSLLQLTAIGAEPVASDFSLPASPEPVSAAASASPASS